MPRRAQPWQRSDRPGWRVWLNGKQVFLGLDKADAFREWHRRLSLETPAEPGTQTVEALADRYLVENKTEWAEPTLRGKKFALQSFVDQYGTMKAADLLPLHVTAWLKRQTTWAQATKRQQAAVIKTWSNWCAREGYLKADMLRPVRVKGGQPRKGAPPGDLEKLIAAADDPAFRDFLIVLGDTGARPGEIRSLESSRIAFTASTAEVRGKSGQRVVGLTARALRVLARYARKYPSGPVLRNGHGMPWSASTLKRRFDHACKLASIAHFIPYFCRHDLARRLLKAKVPELLIRDQMGHVDLEMIAKTYLHSEASMLAGAVERGVSVPAKPARARKASTAQRQPKRAPRSKRKASGRRRAEKVKV